MNGTEIVASTKPLWLIVDEYEDGGGFYWHPNPKVIQGRVDTELDTGETGTAVWHLQIVIPNDLPVAKITEYVAERIHTITELLMPTHIVGE